MKLTHHGHACLTVDIADARLLIDPGNFSPRAASLTDITAIVITHQHADHADPGIIASVLANSSAEVPVYAEPAAAAQLRAAGIACSDLAPGDTVQCGSSTVQGVGGEHAVIHADIPRIPNTGLVITAPGAPRLGVTGDSQQPCPEFVGIDALAFAITAPWTSVGAMIDGVRAVHPRKAIPVHDAVASAAGRAIAVRLLQMLKPEGTEFCDWPENRVIEL